MKTRLKIKIKCLAAEATIIRKEERKALGAFRWSKAHQQAVEADALAEKYNSLRMHRVNEVRQEAYCSQIAYAFLRGKTFRQTQNKGQFPPGLKAKTRAMIQRFGLGIASDQKALAEAFDRWLDA